MMTKEDISIIADLIIPQGQGGEPPASKSRASDFILDYLESGRKYSDEIIHLLEGLSEASCIDEAVLRQVESKYPEPFRRLVELVYTAYYGDPEIVEKLGLPGPPQPSGHRMEPFDERLLAPGKKSPESPEIR